MQVQVAIQFRGPDRLYKPGEVVELSESDAADLIALRYATRVLPTGEQLPARKPRGSKTHKRRDMRAEA